MICEHANENPNLCPCDAWCACRLRACRHKATSLTQKMLAVSADVDHERAYGCTPAVRWHIEFALMWAMIASVLPAPRPLTRFGLLEVDTL